MDHVLDVLRVADFFVFPVNYVANRALAHRETTINFQFFCALPGVVDCVHLESCVVDHVVFEPARMFACCTVPKSVLFFVLLCLTIIRVIVDEFQLALNDFFRLPLGHVREVMTMNGDDFLFARHGNRLAFNDLNVHQKGKWTVDDFATEVMVGGKSPPHTTNKQMAGNELDLTRHVEMTSTENKTENTRIN